MPASWKKIVLEGLEANLNQITASSGIQIAPSLTLTAATDNSFDVLVADSTTGDVKGEDQATIGAQGSNTLSFVTMSIGGTPTVSSSQANDTLTILTGSEGPLSIEGTSAVDQLTFTVATASREFIEDTANDLLTGPHQDITVNYDDAGNGTFSLTGSLPLSYVGEGSGDQQEKVELSAIINVSNPGLPVSQAFANTVHFNNNDDVKFGDITASNAPFYYTFGVGATLSEITDNPLGSTNVPLFHGGAGNISQRSDLQVHGAYGGYLSPYQQGAEGVDDNMVYNNPVGFASGDFISASALHITGNAGINNDLTMSGDFIFQGFTFGDSHVLTHTGNNIFGSGSMPTALTSIHQFTGSIVVTGSSITLQQSNSFNGDGSGLSNITTSSIEDIGLLYTQSFGDEIGTEISGAFHFLAPTLRTASLTNGTVSAITASGDTVTSTHLDVQGISGLASGKQIFTFLSASDAAFLNNIAANYVVSASSIADATRGLDITTTGDIGAADGVVSQTIRLNISKSGADASSVLAEGDKIMFMDNSVGGDPTVKQAITSLAFLTGSSTGTVTNIIEGDGITINFPTGYQTILGGSTVVTVPVETQIDIVLSGSEGAAANNSNTYQANGLDVYTLSNLSASADKIALNPYVKLEGSAIASTGSFKHLKVTDTSFLGKTEELTMFDNFILLNSNVVGTQGDNEDAGISVNRGSSDDANLFWDELKNRWSINLTNLQSGSSDDPLTGYSITETTPDSYLAVTTFGDSSYPDVVNPLMPGGTGDGVGNIHVNTTNASAPEVWIYA